MQKWKYNHTRIHPRREEQFRSTIKNFRTSQSIALGRDQMEKHSGTRELNDGCKENSRAFIWQNWPDKRWSTLVIKHAFADFARGHSVPPKSAELKMKPQKNSSKTWRTVFGNNQKRIKGSIELQGQPKQWPQETTKGAAFCNKKSSKFKMQRALISLPFIKVFEWTNGK